MAPFKFLGLLFSQFKESKQINASGYVFLTKQNEFEHRAIAKRLIGRDLYANEVVHHINGSKTDNRVKNLCLMDREKHKLFHAELSRWKEENGKYPKFRDQKRVLEEEYGGTLLEKLEAPSQPEPHVKEEISHNRKYESTKLELFLVRRNKITNKYFIEFDEEVLISPDGKDVELDTTRFGDPEEVSSSKLTEKQITACHNKEKNRVSEYLENDKRLERQRKLFLELRKERKRIADAKGVPAYIVFDDKTLTEIAQIMPVSESLMLQISGVGPDKLRMYGAHFINVVKKFKSAG